MTSDWTWDDSLDALIAAPAQHRLLFENAHVRVLDTRIAPGERTPVHTHRWPASHFVVSWSDFVRRDADGAVLVDTRTASARATPEVLWGEPLPPHSLENVGAAPLHIISTELKAPSRHCERAHPLPFFEHVMSMDHSTALAELLDRHGFHRHELTRSTVGHFMLVGELAGRQLDVLLDTGAARTVVDLAYCRAEGIPTEDTGRVGGGAGGITLPIHTLGDMQLTLDGLPVRSDGIAAIDLSHVNQGLTMSGAGRIHAILGVDVLREHQAVIDYATLSLYLRHGAVA